MRARASFSFLFYIILILFFTLYSWFLSRSIGISSSLKLSYCDCTVSNPKKITNLDNQNGDVAQLARAHGWQP